ncbi:hypothetical protein [Streptomyces olivaceoviridis]|uniref:hypothetical protein n=1 Tax=Streptomyces olivaceoviridis TaxID=1921 RepID=UPI001676D691|nr:hypothetical protein [Streptomyces olivaceoviridis]
MRFTQDSPDIPGKATDLYVLGQGCENGRTTQAAWFVRGGSTIKRGKYTTYNATQADYGATGVIADLDENGCGLRAGAARRRERAGHLLPAENAGGVHVLRGGRITEGRPGRGRASTRHWS